MPVSTLVRSPPIRLMSATLDAEAGRELSRRAAMARIGKALRMGRTLGLLLVTCYWLLVGPFGFRRASAQNQFVGSDLADAFPRRKMTRPLKRTLHRHCGSWLDRKRPTSN